MYYFAGSITMAWGLALWWALPPDPVRVRGYSERERYILVARLRSNNAGVRNTHLKVGQIKELLLDSKFWTVFAISFLSMIANGPISTFIPILIKGFGFNELNSLLLMMPTGAFAGTMQLILPYLAFRFNNIRTYLICVAQVITMVAALLLWLLPIEETGGLLFAVIILPGVGAGYAVLMGLAIANTAGYTKKSVASSGMYIGYCLGTFGSFSRLPLAVWLTQSRQLCWAPRLRVRRRATVSKGLHRRGRDVHRSPAAVPGVPPPVHLVQPEAG